MTVETEAHERQESLSWAFDLACDVERILRRKPLVHYAIAFWILQTIFEHLFENHWAHGLAATFTTIVMILQECKDPTTPLSHDGASDYQDSMNRPAAATVDAPEPEVEVEEQYMDGLDVYENLVDVHNELTLLCTRLRAMLDRLETSPEIQVHIRTGRPRAQDDDNTQAQ